MIYQFALIKTPINFLVISFLCHFINSQSITIISAKSKTARRKYSNETISIIITLPNARKLHGKIANYIKISKLIITKILQQALKNLNKRYYKTRYVGQFIKLNVYSQKVLICHIE